MTVQLARVDISDYGIVYTFYEKPDSGGVIGEWMATQAFDSESLVPTYQGAIMNPVKVDESILGEMTSQVSDLNLKDIVQGTVSILKESGESTPLSGSEGRSLKLGYVDYAACFVDSPKIAAFKCLEKGGDEKKPYAYAEDHHAGDGRVDYLSFTHEGIFFEISTSGLETPELVQKLLSMSGDIYSL